MLFSCKKSFKYSYSLILVAIIIALALFGFSQAAYTPTVQAASLYSCGTGASGHCYGIGEWDGPMQGADSRIGTTRISGGDCFVDNEMWVTDSSISYWTEAGITADINFSPANAVELFWADNRPGGGYHEHFSNPLVSGDYGSNAYTRITQSGSSFNVYVGAPVTTLSGTSINNSFAPYVIQIGMELCGSDGASVPPTGISNNRWYNGTNFNYQTRDFDYTEIGYPINAYWQPAPSGGSGGNRIVCITGAGC